MIECSNIELQTQVVYLLRQVWRCSFIQICPTFQASINNFSSNSEKLIEQGCLLACQSMSELQYLIDITRTIGKANKSLLQIFVVVICGFLKLHHQRLAVRFLVQQKRANTLLSKEVNFILPDRSIGSFFYFLSYCIQAIQLMACRLSS